MALHGLASVTIGVPDVGSTTGYYTDFGLTPQDDGWLSSADGGRQLRLVPRPRRQLVELVVRAESRDDLGRIAASLSRLGLARQLDDDQLTAVEPVVGARVVVRVAPPLVEGVSARAAYNGPGRLERSGRRAEGVLRTGPVRPTRLGHAVLGTTNLEASRRFVVVLPTDPVIMATGARSCAAPPSTTTCSCSPRR